MPVCLLLPYIKLSRENLFEPWTLFEVLTDGGVSREIVASQKFAVVQNYLSAQHQFAHIRGEQSRTDAARGLARED